MAEAVFLDYTGTIIQEGGAELREVIKRCCQNSDVQSPEAMTAWWWARLKKYELACCGDAFLTEDEIVDRLLDECAAELHLRDNKEELHGLFRGFWTNAPAFEDAVEFFGRCALPVFVITNNGKEYVEKGLAEKGIYPAGIISGEMAEAYKPHRELFLKALEISGFRADEVVHIGDSLESDVRGAESAGIRAILLDRKGDAQTGGYETVRSLTEALEYI